MSDLVAALPAVLPLASLAVTLGSLALWVRHCNRVYRRRETNPERWERHCMLGRRIRQRAGIVGSYLPVHRLTDQDRYLIRTAELKRYARRTGKCHTCLAIAEDGDLDSAGMPSGYCIGHEPLPRHRTLAEVRMSVGIRQ